MISNKMVWLRIVLISSLILVQIGLTQLLATDENQQVADLRVEFRIPDNAVIGSTPERKVAYDSLSKEEKEELFKLFGTYLDDAIKAKNKAVNLRKKTL